MWASSSPHSLHPMPLLVAPHCCRRRWRCASSTTEGPRLCEALPWGSQLCCESFCFVLETICNLQVGGSGLGLYYTQKQAATRVLWQCQAGVACKAAAALQHQQGERVYIAQQKSTGRGGCSHAVWNLDDWWQH